MKATQKIKRALKATWETILFVLGFDGEIRRESVDDGICDYSGQGRNKYGK